MEKFTITSRNKLQYDYPKTQGNNGQDQLKYKKKTVSFHKLMFNMAKLYEVCTNGVKRTTPRSLRYLSQNSKFLFSCKVKKVQHCRGHNLT